MLARGASFCYHEPCFKPWGELSARTELVLFLVYDIDPVLLMLACAAGSNTITMPNDAAFWLMKETFNLSMAQTFKTWGLLELVNSLVGLGIVLILSLFI